MERMRKLWILDGGTKQSKQEQIGVAEIFLKQKL